MGYLSRIVVVAVIVAFIWTEASGAPHETPPKFAFVRALQKALRADDRAWLADHIRYPLRHHGRVAIVIRNRSDFIRNYPALVSDRLRTVILGQEPRQIFENWQGVMVGDGADNVWLRESGEGDSARYEIVAINDAD